MSLTITIPTARTGRTIHGGIAFTDGTATVPGLAPAARAFFDAIGAEVRDTATAAPTSRADVFTLTIPGIRDLADQHDIDLPSRGKHDDLAATVAAVLFPEE